MKEMNIFDLGVEEVDEKVEKKPTSKPTTKGTKPKVTPKPKEEVKVEGDWTIHFATESFEVSDFVDEIPEGGVTLEALRVELEKVYFQFTATRTKWDVDKENKRLFPDATGAAKGAY
jgi:hypothetical protein